MMETVLQYLSTVCIYPSVAAFKIGCNPPEANLVNIKLNIFFLYLALTLNELHQCSLILINQQSTFLYDIEVLLIIRFEDKSFH